MDATAKRPHVNKRELAAHILQCSVPTLDSLLLRYGDEFPVVERGSNGVEWKFDGDEVRAFLKRKKQEAAAVSAEKAAYFAQFELGIDSIVDEKAKELTPQQRAQLASARMKERDLALQAGLLVETSEVRRCLTMFLTRLGQSLDNLPGQLARTHNLPEAVTRQLRMGIDEARRNAHRELKAVFTEAAEAQEARDGTRG